MARRYLHVAFSFRTENKSLALEPVFNKAIDWIRYTPTNWLLWTNRDAADWYRRVKPILDDGDHVFIAEVDLDQRAGWLPKSVWNWINEDRTADAD